MKCLACGEEPLTELRSKRGVSFETCPYCRGLWLDAGEVLRLAREPEKLEARLRDGLTDVWPAYRRCPRCDVAMQVAGLKDMKLEVERCTKCQGLWFDAGELKRLLKVERPAKAVPYFSPFVSDLADDALDLLIDMLLSIHH